MSGYPRFVPPLENQDIELRATAWLHHFDQFGKWVVDLPRILEVSLPRVLPSFVLRIQDRASMGVDEGMTYHTVPAIDLREDVYEQLCNGEPRARFTAAHELGHLFLHDGDPQPRSGGTKSFRTIPRAMNSESQADTFAAAFLMPEVVVREFSSPTLLAEGCRVSHRAAELRMIGLGLWPKARAPIPEVEEFLRVMKEKAKRSGRNE